MIFVKRLLFYLFFLLMSKIILYRQCLLYLPNYSLISQFTQETFHQSTKYKVKTFTLVSNIHAFYAYAFV